MEGREASVGFLRGRPSPVHLRMLLYVCVVQSILRPSLVIFLSLLATMATLRAVELVPENVVFERDIEFSNTDDQHLQVNLARPKEGTGPLQSKTIYPAVVCIHGGGFESRRERTRAAACRGRGASWPRASTTRTCSWSRPSVR